MPKLERLLKLAQLTREQKAGTIRELSQACGVSQRTIFRYLNTLSSLNLPDELHADPRKTAGESLSQVIDSDDQCLLCFALDHNPLVQYEYLARRLGQIKRVLSGGRWAGGGVLRGGVIEVKTSSGSRKKTAGDRILSIFAAACRSGDYLLVGIRGSAGESMLQPRAIKIQSKGIKLSFRTPSRGRYVSHDLSSIVSVHLARKESGMRSR